jgi:hypothetical protein
MIMAMPWSELVALPPMSLQEGAHGSGIEHHPQRLRAAAFELQQPAYLKKVGRTEPEGLAL